MGANVAFKVNIVYVKWALLPMFFWFPPTIDGVRVVERLRPQCKPVCAHLLFVWSPNGFSLKAGFNQQIAQYRDKVPEQHLTDLAVGHFEDQLAKNQEQVRVTTRLQQQ